MHRRSLTSTSGNATALAGTIAARIMCTLLGGWLAAIVPTELAAQSRRAANLAAGYAPNMDPGVVVSLAALIAAPVLAVALLVELVRCWVMGGMRLTLISHVALGAFAVGPIGYAFAVPEVRLGYPALLVLTSLGIALFYVARRAALLVSTRRAKGP